MLKLQGYTSARSQPNNVQFTGIWITACTRAPAAVAGILGEDNGGACGNAWAEQRDGGGYPLHMLGIWGVGAARV